METEDETEEQEPPNKNASIQRSIMFRLVLGMRPKIWVTTKMMNGVQEGKALKIILICCHVNYFNIIAKKWSCSELFRYV